MFCADTILKLSHKLDENPSVGVIRSLTDTGEVKVTPDVSIGSRRDGNRTDLGSIGGRKFLQQLSDRFGLLSSSLPKFRNVGRASSKPCINAYCSIVSQHRSNASCVVCATRMRYAYTAYVYRRQYIGIPYSKFCSCATT